MIGMDLTTNPGLHLSNKKDQLHYLIERRKYLIKGLHNDFYSKKTKDKLEKRLIQVQYFIEHLVLNNGLD